MCSIKEVYDKINDPELKAALLYDQLEFIKAQYSATDVDPLIAMAKSLGIDLTSLGLICIDNRRCFQGSNELENVLFVAFFP